MNKMKTPVCMIIMLLAISHYVRAGITDVSISPLGPTINDAISIIIEGEEWVSPIDISNTVFSTNGSNLTLDIYLETGMLQVYSPWSHNENIGMLSAGTYQLEVNAIYGPSVSDTFETSFEVVVPEPTSMLLLLSGTLFLYRIKN
jgi:hypothetical protein